MIAVSPTNGPGPSIGNHTPLNHSQNDHQTSNQVNQASSSKNTLNRHPTLSFPSLHLGSFDTLTVDNFPSPTSPTRLAIPSPPTVSRDTGAYVDGGYGSELAARAREEGFLRIGDDNSDKTQVRRKTSSGWTSKSRESSKSSLRSNGPRSIPPPLPPPNMELPPLPTLSPTSPIGPISPTSSSSMSAVVKSSTTSSFSAAQPTISPAPLSPTGPRESSPRKTKPNPGLSIIPTPYQPTEMDRVPSGSSAVLRSSPGMPRRRTIVESKHQNEGSEALISRALDDDAAAVTLEKMKLDAIHRGEGIENQPPSPTHKLEKKASTNNLKANASPTSPGQRRSLPRPPSGSRPSFDNATQPQPINLNTVAPKPIKATSPRVPLTNFQDAPQHRASPSASTIPVIAGLADAGPYPSSNRGSVKGVPLNIQPVRKVQEEICLECMMRDRDLADIVVTGDGVWERASDVAWEDLKRREETVLKSYGSSLRIHNSGAGSSSEEEEGFSASPQSTANSLEDVEQRRQYQIRKKKRAAARQKRKEAEQRIAKEVGWRGFKWEEGAGGEGFPRAFRGNKGGPLSEDGIKAVMTKFPSASAHRYNALQLYLRHQYLLVLEVASEAKRLGYYPIPVEMIFSSPASTEGYMPGLLGAAESARTAPLRVDTSFRSPSTREYAASSRLAWAPEVSPNMGGVRASPSSPADLAFAGRMSRPQQSQRPVTHFIPEREPIPGAAYRGTQPLDVPVRVRPGQPLSAAGSPGSVGVRDTWAGNLEDNEELWEPVSPGESGIRPFSFAVRAGAVREGSEGHGRRSMFGRWGGSVTSLFGGSQGGSGSMMDMHLGLDSDRRNNRASSQHMHTQPRAVSLASPARPSFFSRSSSDRLQSDRPARSMSNSRLSQMLPPEEEDDGRKSKGLKGLLKKMKPRKRNSGSLQTSSPNNQSVDYNNSDYSSQLAPPPNMAYLVGSSGKHGRNRSGSSSSMLTDSQSSSGPAPQRRESGPPHNPMRSVSVPVTAFMAGSSSGGSQNASPISSRFDRFGTNGGNRESYNSYMNSRRGSGDNPNQPRGSIVEVLQGSNVRSSQYNPSGYPNNSTAVNSTDDERYGSSPSMVYPPHPSFKVHNKTASSLSASSVVETPPPTHMSTIGGPGAPGTYFTQHVKSGSNQSILAASPTSHLSPNRFKNLPPLPPPGSEGESTVVPEMAPYSSQLIPPSQSYGQSDSRSYLPHPNFQAPATNYDRNSGTPRSSFDPPSRPREGFETTSSPRLAQSMYAQPTATGSVGSFGGFSNNPGPDYNANTFGSPQQNQGYGYVGFGSRKGNGAGGVVGGGLNCDSDANVVDLSETYASKGSKSRKGLKSLFGGRR